MTVQRVTSADDDLDEIERWFADRGVPHLIERDTEGSILDVWSRALPLLAVAYLLLGLQALDLRGWTVEENLVTAALVIAMAIGTWALSNRLRDHPTFARPADIDAPELALFFVGPTLPVLVFGQFADAVETVVLAAALLLAVYLWSAYGIGPLFRWALRRTQRQIDELWSLVARALPLLLLFNAFLFINAEVWQVAGRLDGIAAPIVIGTFIGLGATFAITRVPGVVRATSSFEDWDDVRAVLGDGPGSHIELPHGPYTQDRPDARQRLNIALVVLFGPAMQITLVVVAIIAFFVGFGVIAIPVDTTASWIGEAEPNVLAEVMVGDQRWVLTEPLLRVSTFLGAFSGMYFTVLLTTDATYREEFADETGPQIRQAMALRSAYRVALGRHPALTAGPPPVPTTDHGAA